MRVPRLLMLCVASCGLAACSTVSTVRPDGTLASQPGAEIAPGTEVSTETGVVALGLLHYGHPISPFGLPGEIFNPRLSALLYIVYDPMAPNWTIKERVLTPDTFQLSLRAKHFRVGGDGEAAQILKRRALQLQRQRGYASYRILEYSEGIESATPFTYRVSEGTIQLVKNR